jgi:hypothetical protein
LTLDQRKVVEIKALLEKLFTHGRTTPGPKYRNDVAVRHFPRGKPR